jgi:hypothetical protein
MLSVVTITKKSRNCAISQLPTACDNKELHLLGIACNKILVVNYDKKLGIYIGSNRTLSETLLLNAIPLFSKRDFFLRGYSSRLLSHKPFPIQFLLDLTLAAARAILSVLAAELLPVPWCRRAVCSHAA